MLLVDHRRRRRRRRAEHRLIPALAGIALILALFGSFDWGAALAESDPGSTPGAMSEQLIDEPSPSPEPTATQEATTAPPVEPTVEPTLEPTVESTVRPSATRVDGPILIDPADPDEGTDNTVMAVKLTCPAGTDPTASRDVLLGACGMNPLGGVTFTMTDANGPTSEATTPTGNATFTDVDYTDGGSATLAETVPAGYGDPVVYCGEGDTPDYVLTDDISGAVTLHPTVVIDGFITCLFLNFPAEGGGDEEPETGTVRVSKYTCPEGVERSDDDYALSEACQAEVAPISFTVSDGGLTPDRTQTATAGVPQTVEFTGIPFGAIAISEVVPAGYGEPLVFCSDTPADGAGNYEPVPVVFGSAAEWVLRADATIPLTCLFFNFPAEDSGASLTVVKHECPAGYDPETAGVDPVADCPTLVDGVYFRLWAPGPDFDGFTGEDGPGKLRFDVVDPGDYSLVETAPEGTAASFVSECFGNVVGAVRPFPLATGDTLNLTIHAGEEITCHWFNVPEGDDTSLTVKKFTCSTESYVSPVDCEVFEGGQDFDLMVWDGDSWEYVATKTTDGYGVATFGPLDPGQYWLVEPGREWCHLESLGLSEDGTWLEVRDDEPTVAFVYNCDGTPGQPGKTPTRYPDTGVPPVQNAPESSCALPFAGKWNAAISAYDSRIVVRARRIGNQDVS